MPSQRQAEARALRFDGVSFLVIGAILGVSKQRAFQLVNRSEARLRQREQRQRRRERQRALIAELLDILIAAGAVTVTDWAAALNLPRSTAHSLFTARRKNGITRATLKRMLASPQLPPQARARLASWQIPASTNNAFGTTIYTDPDTEASNCTHTKEPLPVTQLLINTS
jgi:hypothetical protein